MKRILKRFALPMVCLFWSHLSPGQNSPFPVDPKLSELIRQMEGYYPNLQIQVQQQLAAQLQTEIARAALRPTLGGMASYSYATPISHSVIPLGNTDRVLQLQPHNNYNTQLQTSYTLTDFGRSRAGVQKAKQNEQVAGLSTASMRHSLRYQVANTYYDLLFTNRAIAVKDTQIAQIQRTAELTQRMLKDGTSIDYDVLAADVRLKFVNNERTDLINQQQKLLVLLNSLTGTDNTGLSRATTEFQFHTIPYNDEEVVQTALRNNPGLVEQRARQQLTHYDLQLSHRAFLPVVTFNGNAGYKNGFAPNVNEVRASTVVGGTVNVPIYNGERNRHQVSLSRTNETIAQLATDNLTNTIRRDVLTALSELRTLGEKYQTVATQVEQVREALNLANVRYQNDVLRPIDVTDAQNNYIQVLLVKVQYEYRLQMAELQLQQLLGEPL